MTENLECGSQNAEGGIGKQMADDREQMTDEDWEHGA